MCSLRADPLLSHCFIFLSLSFHFIHINSLFFFLFTLRLLNEFRTRPDVVVATPGRLLDHLTNSVGVDLDDLEFLILDEADRLLDLSDRLLEDTDMVIPITATLPIIAITSLLHLTITMNTSYNHPKNLRSNHTITNQTKVKYGEHTSHKHIFDIEDNGGPMIRNEHGNDG